MKAPMRPCFRRWGRFTSSAILSCSRDAHAESNDLGATKAKMAEALARRSTGLRRRICRARGQRRRSSRTRGQRSWRPQLSTKESG